MNPETLLDFGLGRRLPVILQTEMAECGLACLAMISSYHGFETDIRKMRSRFSLSSHGVTLRTLIGYSNEMGFSARPIKVDLNQLENVSVPCILHWGMDHFVVLKKIKRDGSALIVDPAVGEIQVANDELNLKFTGVVLELHPTSEFEKGGDKEKLHLKQFFSSAIGLKKSLFYLVVLSLLLQVFALISPLYTQIVIDDVVLRGDVNLLLVVAIGFFILLVVESVTSIIRRFLVLNLSTKLNIQISVNVFRHLINLPLSYFSKRQMGDVVSRFGSIGGVREVLTNGLVSAIVDGVLSVTTFVAMLLYDVKLALIALAVVVLYAIFRFAFYSPVKLLNESQLVAGANESSHFMETIRGISTVKVFQKEEDRMLVWQNLLAKSMNKGIKLGVWDIAFYSGNHIIFGIENILIVYFAALSVIDGSLSIGMFFAFMSYNSSLDRVSQILCRP